MSTINTVDTTNYFTVAASDDQAVASSSSQTPPVTATNDKADRKARREQRIAEAVQRSKVEYTAENVYTERGWHQQSDGRGVQKAKIDQQRLEFLTASLYYSQSEDGNQYQTILEKILEVFEEGKSSGGFPKELLDIGIKSALRCGRKEDAVKLARSGKASWKTQWAGAACSAHDALLAGGESDESLIPLISCMSVGGPQYPLLTRLSAALDRRQSGREGNVEERLFQAKIDDLIRKRAEQATKPMFDSDEAAREIIDNERVVIPERPALDSRKLFEELDLGGLGLTEEILADAVRRLEKATRTLDDAVSDERGVRQL